MPWFVKNTAVNVLSVLLTVWVYGRIQIFWFWLFEAVEFWKFQFRIDGSLCLMNGQILWFFPNRFDSLSFYYRYWQLSYRVVVVFFIEVEFISEKLLEISFFHIHIISFATKFWQMNILLDLSKSFYFCSRCLLVYKPVEFNKHSIYYFRIINFVTFVK